ncbi:MAG: hypothetical protein HGGPFJEG_00999 [Ignavibacteria bacterium]|nr:hypothetical protein [Ignavibacteria bacterium]
MDTYKTKAKVKSNHNIIVENVPFNVGQEVEIVISKKNGNEDFSKLKEELKGSVVKYEGPFEAAISSEDWDLLQ